MDNGAVHGCLPNTSDRYGTPALSSHSRGHWFDPDHARLASTRVMPPRCTAWQVALDV